MKTPELTPVESSLIELIGYDSEAKELFVKFLKTESIFAYGGVTQEQFDTLRAADSIGGHFLRTFSRSVEHPARQVKVDREEAIAKAFEGMPPYTEEELRNREPDKTWVNPKEEGK